MSPSFLVHNFSRVQRLVPQVLSSLASAPLVLWIAVPAVRIPRTSSAGCCGSNAAGCHWALCRASGEKDDDKRRLLAQLAHLDGNYSGGLRAYLRNAKRLLEDSRLGGLCTFCADRDPVSI